MECFDVSSVLNAAAVLVDKSTAEVMQAEWLEMKQKIVSYSYIPINILNEFD